MYRILTTRTLVLPILALPILALLAHPASAEACPPKYRFVDFGMEGPDGVVRRGGTIFRAFNSNGTSLLRPARTICRTVEEMAKDGRGLRIPVVTAIAVDLDVAGIDVTDLRMSVLDDPFAAAEANAALHRDRLHQPNAVITRGPTFLCASVSDDDAVSCQMVSPYENNAALVIYCAAETCEIPLLVRDDQLGISALWPRTATTTEGLAGEISQMIQRIYGFWEEQI